jgi:ferric-dicitrate binding protein FerR (iron transport regulator)
MKKGDYIIKDIELIIIDYLTGSITEENLERLNDWINARNENRIYFNSLKDSWIVSGAKKRDSLTLPDESWRKFRQKGLMPGLKFRSEKKVYFRKYIKLAASWLFIFAMGSAATWLILGKPKEFIATSENSGKTIEITVPLGARGLMKMPDNSQIWLNAGTTITYSQNYGQKTRTLNLTGEAYFEVAKDKEHPFIVNTQGIVVRALGTRFNVKAYPDEKTISATLEEGKIDVGVFNLRGSDDRVLLKPKDKYIYHKETRVTEKYTDSAEDRVNPEGNGPVKLKNINLISNVRTELYTSWKDARWIIDREPLVTLAPLLERRFNLKIIFDDEQLKKYKFTGAIENETVVQILNALKLTAPLEYQMKRDTIILSIDNSSKEKFRRIMTNKN